MDEKETVTIDVAEYRKLVKIYGAVVALNCAATYSIEDEYLGFYHAFCDMTRELGLRS